MGSGKRYERRYVVELGDWEELEKGGETIGEGAARDFEEQTSVCM